MDQLRGIDAQSGMQATRKLKNVYRMSENKVSAADSVEISSEVVNLRGIEGIRLEKVLSIRQQVSAGTYFSAEKLDKALDNAIDQLFGTR